MGSNLVTKLFHVNVLCFDRIKIANGRFFPVIIFNGCNTFLLLLTWCFIKCFNFLQENISHNTVHEMINQTKMGRNQKLDSC